MLHERASFWKPFHSQRVNESPKLLKYLEKHFFATFSSTWDSLSEEKSFLVRCEILVLLVNTLNADD